MSDTTRTVNDPTRAWQAWAADTPDARRARQARALEAWVQTRWASNRAARTEAALDILANALCDHAVECCNVATEDLAEPFASLVGIAMVAIDWHAQAAGLLLEIPDSGLDRSLLRARALPDEAPAPTFATEDAHEAATLRSLARFPVGCIVSARMSSGVTARGVVLGRFPGRGPGSITLMLDLTTAEDVHTQSCTIDQDSCTRLPEETN